MLPQHGVEPRAMRGELALDLAESQHFLAVVRQAAEPQFAALLRLVLSFRARISDSSIAALFQNDHSVSSEMK